VDVNLPSVLEDERDRECGQGEEEQQLREEPTLGRRLLAVRLFGRRGWLLVGTTEQAHRPGV
jgi:hypothetical protein